MRAILQRVSRASVRVGRQTVGQIDRGWLVLLGVAKGDSDVDVNWMVEKVTGLRAFEDEAGKMNLSVGDVKGSILTVSQFTLLGDCRKGRRPSFVDAAEPAVAECLYDAFVAGLRAKQIEVTTGVFRAHMEVELVNDGPVTLLLDTRKPD